MACILGSFSVDRGIQRNLGKKFVEMNLVEAVKSNHAEETKKLLKSGANPNQRDPDSGLTLLMLASGQSNLELTRILLEAEADVWALDSRAGATALHKACQGGSLEIVKLLLEAGAYINASVCTTGHTPVIEALWFKNSDIVGYLLKKGAEININTYYGFSLGQHLDYALKVNVYGREKLEQAKKMLDERKNSDQEQLNGQQLMAAVLSGNLEEVKKLIVQGSDVDERYPLLNGFNDYHTPLLVACREGHKEMVIELLKAGANVNAVEPVFGAVPLHKATYNGYAGITKLLSEHPNINLNFQGYTNGYTPLHDALWHGFDDCAAVLINAGARCDLRGHDGKTPLDIARDVFGNHHKITKQLETREYACSN